jgi:hypothetical protein
MWYRPSLVKPQLSRNIRLLVEEFKDLNLIGNLFVSESCVSRSGKSNNGIRASIIEHDSEAEIEGAFEPVNTLLSVTA